MRSLVAAAIAGALLIGGVPARADNPMGYRLLTPAEASGLPHNRGSLGLDIERARQITDSGITFDILGITGVHRGSPAERAGLHRGDQIIAVDGRVFANLRAFAAYVGALQPGRPASIDVIPAGRGPADAQRVTVDVGGTGMSTGTKVAIGVGAAALLGCYELGCFNRSTPQTQAPN